ncbi:TIGR03745 family integrating conjugative element membrane protein [Lonsdalea populi]|uniref:Conjugal transfer protein n=1 Tax=Lonsdalea populi TaxID=1172565 RepID=A0ABX9EMB0_9GAMM|nr:TIGR03745 family integrating conjugative element membrane protein [Lonsdalea populi]OSN01312.1 conjugal transfer protein [Lonsdalea populi]QPQ24956.1 TIGR03745 family integrating conjugative element membrane protein [Lonsdalea populi]RAT32525.1 conjugal transfer protein [Lonsdalea populi]RAT33975.1 conjugal transfer protein [Lonsdalea populi]RAT41657.1 conjugal transfer protein [Lonsdalea populi]
MKSTLLRFYHSARARAGLLLTALLVSGQALADLPSVEQPTTGGGGGTYNTMMGYAKMGGVAMGLLVCLGTFLIVAHAIGTSFHDVRKGKGSWTEFMLYGVLGIILILAVIYLVTKASDIL